MFGIGLLKLLPEYRILVFPFFSIYSSLSY